MTDFAAAQVSWGSTPDTITLLDLMKQVLSEAGTDNDTVYSMYLNMSGRAAEQYIGNVIDQRSVSENFARIQSPVSLRYWPIEAIEIVLIDEVDKTSEYIQRKENGVEWLLKSPFSDYLDFCSRPGQMVVTYTAGYDPIPGDIGFAIVQGAIAYKQDAATSSSPGNIKKESVVGVGSVEFDVGSATSDRVGNLPRSVAEVLDRYVRTGA